MKRHARKTAKPLLALLMTALGVIWFSPIVFALFASFKTNKELKLFSRMMNLLPVEWTGANYAFVWNNASSPLLRMILNSMFVAVAQVVLVLFVASTSAYAYERLDLPGKEKLFWGLFGLGVLPGIISLVPQYILYDALSWTDTLFVLVLPYIGNVFDIFLLRNFMHGIPRDLDEAVRIDGANELTIYARIILPSIYPAMAVVALFTFTDAWNDLMWPSLAVTSPDKLTITAGIRLLNDAHGGHPERVLAACIVSMLPTVFIYLLTRRYFLQGLSISAGVKG